MDQVRIREVGLRDGLQMVKDFLPTERKVEWCRRTLEIGFAEVEVTSFVPPKAIPQFADADAVSAAVIGEAGGRVSALAMNARGAERAMQAGYAKINYAVSASEAHSRANVRRTTDEALADFTRIAAARAERGQSDTMVLSGGITTCFGCTLQGDVDPERVVEIAVRLVEAGADEILLADTVGYAGPAQVRQVFDAVARAIPEVPLGAHFHDTRGLGLANALAAADVGVRFFDASLGGLGGCPFAPGATGNVDTVDLAFLLERLGLATGLDFDALIALRQDVAAWLPGEGLGGAVQKAGLPINFRPNTVA